MVILTKYTVSFDPVTEYKAIDDFERANPDWKCKHNSSLAVIFEKEEACVFGIEQRGDAE